MAKKRTTKTNSKLRKEFEPPVNWDLYRDGVSYSLLSKFITCRERFRLYAVEGMREVGSSKLAMDFGTFMHRLLELHALSPNSAPHVLFAKNNRKLDEFWTGVAAVIFNRYLWYYEENPYHYLEAESVFDVPLKLPNGKKLRMRGRSDEIIRGSSSRKVWIQENKTKERINTYQIESFLPQNLQTMFYSTAVETKYKKTVEGIVYNVIRKPKYKQKQGETLEEFLERLDKEIEKRPEHFFYRLEYELNPGALKRWQYRTLFPILTDLCTWWDSIKHNPFDPWILENGDLNPHHFLKPFGVYDNLTLGTGDYFDVITRGLENSVIRNQEPFQELKD